ncbi:MAG: phenylalanine--tRNA ligase subunit alpha, partial [Actinomycetota bacterium]
MIDELTEHERSASSAIDAATTLVELNEAKTAALGKGAPLTAAQRSLGSLPAEDRKAAGQALNEVRRRVESMLEDKTAALAAAERVARLAAERLDLTEVPVDPQVGHTHVVTQAWEELEDVFVGMGFNVAEGPEVETDWHNFDALNIPKGHPARDGFDTLYVDHGEAGSTVLR